MKRTPTPHCKYCKQPFVPERPGAIVCSVPCAIGLAEKKREKAVLEGVREMQRQVKARREAIQPLQYWLKRAERAVNAYVRERDREQPCISCGTFDAETWHAGHWISVGASSALRYDLANINRQCRQCNWFEGGRSADYEARLPAKIGQAEVDRLKHAKRERKWTREECQQIEAEFKAKTKELKVAA